MPTCLPTAPLSPSTLLLTLDRGGEWVCEPNQESGYIAQFVRAFRTMNNVSTMPGTLRFRSMWEGGLAFAYCCQPACSTAADHIATSDTNMSRVVVFEVGILQVARKHGNLQ
jgi:hypothetical protein